MTEETLDQAPVAPAPIQGEPTYQEPTPEPEQAAPTPEQADPDQNGPGEPEQPALSVNDFVLMMQIINVVSARGGVKPEEMEDVGGLYKRLHSFLDQAGVLDQKPQK